MTDARSGALQPDAALTVEQLTALVGQELGVSAWRTVTQSDLDAFASVTDDHQFIHVDQRRTLAETSYGGTIAHGFLTLSLLSAFGRDALPAISERRMGVNYGFDRVRFISPVRSGSRVRGRFTLRGADQRAPNELLLRYGVTVEIEGGAKPALAAEWLTLAILSEKPPQAACG